MADKDSKGNWSYFGRCWPWSGGMYISECFEKSHGLSPFTLGISQGAALGVTLSVVLFRQTLPYLTSLFAFLGAMMTTLLIILISSRFKVTPEAMILTGVSLSSLFSALTTIIQYFADELKIATVVFGPLEI